MTEFNDFGESFVGVNQEETPVAADLPIGNIDFTIPYVKKKPFLSTEIQYWGVAVSGGSMYLYMRSSTEMVTVTRQFVDDDVDSLIDGVRGFKMRKAYRNAVEVGLQKVLSLTTWHRLTPAEAAGVRTRRGLTRFTIPPRAGREKSVLYTPVEQVPQGIQEKPRRAAKPEVMR